jgi:hypothetical protein
MRKRALTKYITGALVLMLAIPGTVAGAAAAGKSSLDVQCVADQKSVGKGGKIGLHLLYHNVENKNISKAWLKVKVPGGLEVEEAAGAEWDAQLQTLKWNIKDMETNGADVVHLNLKVKADAKADSTFDFACTGGADGELDIVTPPVRVVLGTEVHQPVFNGYPDGGFHPASYLTRAETAAVIARLSNLTNEVTDKTYSDVPAGHWAAGYIRKVAAAGYMTGVDGKFAPEQPISRAEFAALILKVRGVKAFPLKGFDDTKGHWADQVAGTAKALGLMDGTGGNKASIDRPVERDVAAKWLSIIYYRGALQDGTVKVEQHWPDVPKNHWAFGWVEELSLVAHEGENKAPMKESLIKYLPAQTEPF